MKLEEIKKSRKHKKPTIPVAPEDKRGGEVDDSFELLDGTATEKPYSIDTIMKAMGELHKRIERQANNYGANIDSKTGKMDAKQHKFFPAQISKTE